ncbi:carboxypeptidase-like regulatory domain-containing protein [Flavobacteriaceae bacterium SZ-1-7]|uniref:carboxypeptidase-like regulatory domain-containing protein n=1 Tax=Tamlana sedimenti TaxID=3134126 RepID=UPI00312702C3
MKKILFVLAMAFGTCFCFSQSITAKLIDKNNGNPITYATIKTGEFTGVISNEEGYFTINLDNASSMVTISCLGYQNKTLSIQEIKNSGLVIELAEAVNQLAEVYLSNKEPNADSIIAKVKRNISKNYDYELNKYHVFRRNSDYVDFKSLAFEIEKASHVKKKNIEQANTDLMALSKKIRESDMTHFTDFKGELYSFNLDSSKLIVNKATKLIDYKNDFSIEDVQTKATQIMLTYLDTTKTYKVKTGIFKVEDSLSLKDEDFEKEEKNEFNITNLNNETRNMLRKTQYCNNSFLSNILDSDLYEYAFEYMTINNDKLTYVINFEPRKGKAIYTGKIYVADSTYAVTRLDYNFYKNRHGGKLNLKLLLGVKYIANVSEGTLLFEKNKNNTYHLKYLKETEGSYFYVNRDLKFIENSRAKNKIGFSFKIEGDNRSKKELLFTDNSKLTLNDFASIKQDSIAPYKVLDRFEDTLWQDDETLEPLQEMKAFGVGK